MRWTVADPWDTAVLEKCDLERKAHRLTHDHLTYDCQNARVRGERVYCSAGHRLVASSLDGSMYLLAVLRGRTSTVCRTCRDFDNGEEG